MIHASKKSLTASAVLLLAFANTAHPGEISEQEIFKALTASKTRGLTSAQPSAFEASAPDHRMPVDANGHADAKGSTGYNQKLSKRRPEVRCRVTSWTRSDVGTQKLKNHIEDGRIDMCKS
jgi:hypothetical protein